MAVAAVICSSAVDVMAVFDLGEAAERGLRNPSGGFTRSARGTFVRDTVLSDASPAAPAVISSEEFPERIKANLAFLRAFSSPSGHRWQ
jgi:hypothetical protein